MFKCRRFKSSFNVYNGTLKGAQQEYESYRTTSLNGAYRVNRDEFLMYDNSSSAPEKVKVAAPLPPPNPSQQILKPVPQTKSSRQVVKDKNTPLSVPQTSGVSLNPQGPSEPRRNSSGPSTNNNNSKQLDAHKRVEKKRLEEQKKLEKKSLKEQKTLEKRQLKEQKKNQKLALQEAAKQEKLRKEREKLEAQQLKRDKKNKTVAPQRPLANPLAQSSSQATTNLAAQTNATPYSTNTLNSSISKTSGPPPYTEVAAAEKSQNDSSNVQFSKPLDTGSWDLVSQHRHNVIVNRHANVKQSAKGQTTMDLNFTLGEGKSD